jgi:hypothetical protein
MATINIDKPQTICLLQVSLNALKNNLHFFTGPIKIQSQSIMVRYFFVDCQFFDPTRITLGNIASLKYYNEGIVPDIDMRILIELKIHYYLA